jgi:hypothetical protein
MDDQSKREAGGRQPATPDAGSGPRDLSFLWPVIDRIRAVEIKFEGGDSAAQPADMEARIRLPSR